MSRATARKGDRRNRYDKGTCGTILLRQKQEVPYDGTRDGHDSGDHSGADKSSLPVDAGDAECDLVPVALPADLLAAAAALVVWMLQPGKARAAYLAVEHHAFMHGELFFLLDG